MREYRVYVLDPEDHVKRRHDFTAVDDADAMKQAHQSLDGHDLEIWNLDRVVGRLSHGPGADYAMLAGAYRERAKIAQGEEAERLIGLAEHYERLAKPGVG